MAFLKELQEVEKEAVYSPRLTTHILFSLPGILRTILGGLDPWQLAEDAIAMANPHSSC